MDPLNPWKNLILSGIFCYVGKMKPFTNIEEQIEILISRNLIINDISDTQYLLSQYGYYEIINGYKDCFLIENSENFKPNVTFKHIFDLYQLDKSIQQTIRNAPLEFELALKSSMSYVIAENFGVKENNYLNRINYKSGNFKSTDEKGNKIYAIDETLKKFRNISKDNAEPFSHYRNKHGHIPHWILFKGATLGNMVKFYNLQKAYIKDEIMAHMLFLKDENLEHENLKILKDFFNDVLSLSLQFRNRTSHSGRTFNYRPYNKNIRYCRYFHNTILVTKQNYKNGLGRNDLYSYISSLLILLHSNSKVRLYTHISHDIETYINKYPSDENFILSSIGYPLSANNKKISEILEIMLYKNTNLFFKHHTND